jgi:hypothetical protein
MEKIEIIQKFLESLIPERMPEGAWKAGDDFAAGKLYGWNDCREMIQKSIKSADIEKLINELQ